MSTPPKPGNLVKLAFSHRNAAYEAQLPAAATLAELRAHVSDLTHVPTSNLKLLPRAARGVDLNAKDESRTLAQVGLEVGGALIKVLVLGATQQEVEREAEAVEEKKRREGPRNYHPSMLRGAQVSSYCVETTKLRLLSRFSPCSHDGRELHLVPPHRHPSCASFLILTLHPRQPKARR